LFRYDRITRQAYIIAGEREGIEVIIFEDGNWEFNKALGFFFDFIPPTALAMNIINWGVLLVGSNCFNLLFVRWLQTICAQQPGEELLELQSRYYR
jgi:hypothetical protein